MPLEAFQKYQSMTGGTPDSATGLLSITAAQYANLQPLTFTIGGNSYELSPNGQIWPRSLNTAIGGSSSAIYLIVHNVQSQSGSGLDVVLGYAFLYVYIVFCLHFAMIANGLFSTFSVSVSTAYLILATDESVLLRLPIRDRRLIKRQSLRTIELCLFGILL